MTSFIALVKALPEILAFLSWLRQTIDTYELQTDISKGVKQVHLAFADKSPDELKKIFNS